MRRNKSEIIKIARETPENIDAIELRFQAEDVVICTGDELSCRQEASSDLASERVMRVRTEGRRFIAEAGLCDGLPFGRRSASVIVLTLPKDTEKDIEARTASGDIRMRELRAGALRCQSASGDIRLSDVDCARLDAKSKSGDVSVSGLHCAAECELTAASGDVAMDGDARSLRCDTASGDIRVSARRVRDFSGRSKSGDISLSAEEPHSLTAVSANTLSGDIRLCLPAGTAVQVSFMSSSGSMKTKNANGIVFGGDNAIPVEARTASGDVIFRGLE